MYCKQCGNLISTNHKFCPKCGKSTIIDPKKASNRGLIILFIITICISIILILAIGGSSDESIGRELVEDIVDSEPSTSDAVYISLESDIENRFVGVWQLSGFGEDISDISNVVPYESEDNIYLVVEVSGPMYLLSIAPDNTLIYREELSYTQEEGILISEAPEGSPEGAKASYQMINGQLGGYILVDGSQASEWIFYEKTTLNPEDILAIN